MKKVKIILGLFILASSFSLAPLVYAQTPPAGKIKPIVSSVTPTTANAVASPQTSPTPFQIELPIDVASRLGTIEFSNEKLDEGLKPKVIILLDSSGSMGQILDKGKSKMYYAKKLFGSYLADQWREKAEVGMVVYGSRRKRDCSDTYMPFPVGERNLSKIDAAVKKMSPTGMTPIASSLEIAIDQLKSYPGPKRVMIFTDGEETCGGDSCKILEKAIQEKVFDLEMFVTGIGLTAKSRDLDKLRCLGNVQGAPDSKSLEQALNNINDQINHKGGKGADHVAGHNLFVDAPEPKATVKLYQMVNGQKQLVKTFVGSQGVTVPPGEYSAEVLLDPVYTFKSFKIPPQKTVRLKVVGVGYLQVSFFNNLLDVEILNRDKKVVQSFESDQLATVKSGEYDVRVFAEPFYEHYVKKYRVIPGKKQEIPIDDLGVVQVDYPKPVGLHVYDGNDKEIGTYLANFPFVLRAGTYRFYVNENCNLDGITVRKEKTVQRLRCLPKQK